MNRRIAALAAACVLGLGISEIHAREMLISSATPPQPFHPEHFVRMSDSLTFFLAQASTTTRLLWRTDGIPNSTDGTRLIRADVTHTDCTAVVGSSMKVADTPAGKRLFYLATKPGSPNLSQVCATDGTATDVLATATSADNPFLELTPFGDRVFFSGYDAVHGRELWSSDGFPGSGHTDRFADINQNPVVSGSSPQHLTVHDGFLYFAASVTPPVGATTTELWRTNGTSAPVKVESGTPNRQPSSLASVPGMGLLFRGLEAGAFDLLKAATGSSVVVPVTTGGLSPIYIVAAGPRAFFISQKSPTALYVTDGATATRGQEFSHYEEPIALGTGVLVNATEVGSVSEKELWYVTPSASVKVFADCQGCLKGGSIKVRGSTAYFASYAAELTGAPPYELFAMDAFNAPLAKRLTRFTEASIAFGVHDLIPTGSAVLLGMFRSGSIDQLWKYVATPAADLNGDGKGDILFEHTDTRVALWEMDGLVVTDSDVILGSSGWAVTHTGDFNGDGAADIVLKSGDGKVAIWLMIGETAIGSALILNPGDGSVVTHVADVNGDGKSELIWKNGSAISVWLMDGVSAVGTQVLVGSLDITHTGDFNGDGKADLIGRNGLGETVMWLTNGSTNPTAAVVVSDPAWLVSHVADFDNDGKSDLVWKNTSTAVATWLMNGLAPAATSLTYAGGPWSVTHVADLNGDGRGDLVWRHTDGSVAVWLMSGTSAIGSGVVFGAGDWRVVTTPDLNADGRSDLVWAHLDGSVSAWLMNGLSVSSSAVILGPSTGWSVIPVPK